MLLLFAVCIFVYNLGIQRVYSAVIVAELQPSSDIDIFQGILQDVATKQSGVPQLIIRRTFVDSQLFRGIVIEHDGIHQKILDELTKCLQQQFPGFMKFWGLDSGSVRKTSQKYQTPISQPLSARKIHPRDAPVQLVQPDISGIHTTTGVQRLHDRGIIGQGTTVALIDVGLDYLHPAFQTSYNRTFYGTDLVGDDFVPAENATQPDDDAYSECQIHGTHTSALVVGQHQSVGFVGVAPGANLEHYRVKGCQPTERFDDTVLIDALLLAHSRRVDVISMSLTNLKGPYTAELVSDIIRRILQDNRTMCVLAAGNAGTTGAFSSVSPAAASGVVSAGAVNSVRVARSNPVARASYFVGGAARALYFEWQPSMQSRFPESLPICPLSQNSSATHDACIGHEADPDEPRDLEGCVVLVRRGGCSLNEKMEYIVSRGATYALIYDNKTTDPWDIFLYDNLFHGIHGTGSLLAETGQELVTLFSQAENVTLQMDSNFTFKPEVRVRENPLYLPGSIYTGGSWGPTGDLSIFPSILGPGGSVWSALPRSAGGYGTYSGTSISAPYIAGCLALLRSAHPDWSATDITRALVSTATPLPFNNGNHTFEDIFAPVWQQGGGLVNLTAAADSETKLSTPFLAFNDMESVQDINFTITNARNGTTIYNLSSISAATVPTLDSNRHVISFAENTGSQQAINQILTMSQRAKDSPVQLIPSSLSLNGGESAIIRASINATSIANEQTCPLYSGYIRISDSFGFALRLPYGGIGCHMANVASFPPGWNGTFLAAARYNDTDNANAALEPAPPYTDFRIPRTRTQTPGGATSNLNTKIHHDDDIFYPTINVFPSMVTPYIEAFLEDCSGLSSTGHSFLIDLDKARVSSGFNRIAPRPLAWTGRLDNGSWADSGAYCLRVCAYRTFGTAFDCVQTVPFKLSYI